MKKLFISIAFALASLIPAAAQKQLEAIGEVTCNYDSQDAVHNKREDQNKKTCALLIIHMAKPIDETLYLETVNSQLAVWYLTKRPNGDLLYHLQPGVQRLKLSASGYGPLVFDIPRPVEYQGSKTGALEAKTYEMNLSYSDYGALITSSFFKATVKPLDSNAIVEYGKSPNEMTGLFSNLGDGAYETDELPFGKYYYRITSEFFETASGAYVLTEDSDPLEIELKPRFARLKIESDPKGATIYVDGKAYSERRRYLRGEHTVRAALANYSDYNSKIYVEGNGGEEFFRLKMESNQGSVTVTCSDPEAMIYIDDKQVGHSGTVYSVKGGLSHKIESRREGFEPRSTSFTVKVGEKRTVAVEPPVELFGVLNVSSTPGNATVSINGEKIGTTRLKKKLRIGSYTVSCSYDGYLTQTKTVTIEREKTTNLDFKLEKGRLKAKVTLTTESDAIISVDGKSTGKSGTYTAEMYEGDHEVRSSKNGFNDGVRTITVSGSSPQKFTIPNPTVKTGKVSITTNPSGASVRIFDNGGTKVNEGTAPVTTQLPIGLYDVYASKYKYKTAYRQVRVQDGLNSDVSLTLAREPWLTKEQDFPAWISEFTYADSQYGGMLGYTLGYVPAHWGLSANFSYNFDWGYSSASILPILRLSNDYSKLDFQLYAGAGLYFGNLPYSYYYNGYGYVNNYSLYHDNPLFFEAGIRLGINSGLDWISSNIQWLSVSAGLRKDVYGIFPSVGISMIPLYPISWTGSLFEDIYCYASHFGYMKVGMLDEDFLLSMGYQYMSGHMGLYADLGMNFDCEEMYFGFGTSFRFFEDTLIDLQLYSGFNIGGGYGHFGETGIRFAFDFDTAFSWVDFTAGLLYNIEGNLGWTFGFSLGIPLFIYGGWALLDY